MIFNHRVYLIAVVLAFATSIHAACVDTNSEEDLCLYGDTLVSDVFATTCNNVNTATDISQLGMPTNTQDKGMCHEIATKEENFKCNQLYLKFVCSNNCKRCENGVGVLKACFSLCTDFSESCPKLLEQGCLDSLFAYCTEEGDEDCTNWNVDNDRVTEITGVKNGGDGGNPASSLCVSLAIIAPLMMIALFV